MTHKTIGSQPVNRAHPLNRKLAAWFVGLPNSPRGLTWTDIESGHVGTMQGTTSLLSWAGGPNKIQGTLDFPNTATEFLSIPHSADLDFTHQTPMTVSCWVNLDEQGGGKTGYLIDKDATPAFYRLRYTGYGFAFDLRNTFNQEASVGTDSTQQQKNVWMMVTATYDGSETAGGLLIYTNGEDATNSQTYNLNGSFANSAPVEVGYAADGRIGDIRIYRRALSPSEVRDLYRESCAGHPNTLNWKQPAFSTGGAAPPATSAPNRLLLGVGV